MAKSNRRKLESRYSGPRHLGDDVETALKVLSERLSVEQSECKTHSVLAVEDFEDAMSMQAVAVYLVSAISQSIEANLQIRDALFNEESINRELENDVLMVVGESDVDDEFKIMVRDPWMWEAISHLLVHLSRFASAFHPSGHILAKTSVKHDVHDHGLDLIAIYAADELIGISAGECKAYFDDPSRGITHASNKLAEVDANVRDIEIRAAVNQLRSALDEEDRQKLAGTFWRDERSYIPFVCCDDEHAPQWNRNRKSLRQLQVPVARKILIPLSLSQGRSTFDAICETMRAYVALEE